MTFQLDTTGAVALTRSYGPARTLIEHQWPDLSPFTQGYIEALFADGLDEPGVMIRDHNARNVERVPVAFSDLAPETLARIIADCEEYQRIHADLIGISRHPEGLPRLGRLFWIDRQNATVSPFPPLTVQLGDDGKVRFAERG